MKEVGKTPSKSDRLISWVIGTTRASIQDFINPVGITSRVQEESVEKSIRLRISSREASSKFESNGGYDILEGTVVSVLLTLDGIVRQSLVILSSKKLKEVKN